MNQVAVITNELLNHAAILSLPRPTVLSDVRERFHCCESAAREAYALARAEGHARNRGMTVRYVRRSRA